MWKHWVTNVAKIAIDLAEREKVNNGFREVRKLRKSNKNFSYHVKRLSRNKYGKFNEFNKILDLEREKAKKGVEEAAI